MLDLKERLKEVMAVQTITYNTERMNNFITKEASKIPNTKVVKKDGNIYVTRGKADIYPCVIAHTDTVHDMHKDLHVLECGDVLLAVNENYERVGIGGDDKVGIFVALEALRAFDDIKVAFFRDEEVGCHGSKEADMGFFKDVAFVLQCDRQGYDDFVNDIFSTKMYSEEFSKALQPLLYKYGRFESNGGLTDVYQLAENGLEVCVANMSCGYYDPHSDNEYIKMSEVFSTLDFVKEICNDFGDYIWEMKTVDRETYSSYSNYRYHDYGKATRKTYAYRSYNDERPLNRSYSRHLPGEWVDSDIEDDERPGYLVKNATCKKCDGHEHVNYDEYVDAYWCFGCDDYVQEDDIEFSNTRQDDTFLEFIKDRQKLIDEKVDYDAKKEV